MIRSARVEELPQVNILRMEVGSMHSAARPDIFRENAMEARQKAMEASAAEMLEDDDKDIVVCDRQGVVAGFACVDYVIRPATEWAPEQRYCYVKEFGVAEAYRRQGIGKALMNYLREESARRGIHRMELDVWEFNQSAMRLYEGLGFHPRYRYMELDFE